MNLIQSAMEECKSCSDATVKTYTDSKDPKAITRTDATYDDGKGIKDTVMIDGPLSQAFTQALNIKLKKQPLQEQPDEPSQLDAASDIDTGPTTKDELKNLQQKDSPIGLSTESSQEQTETTEAFLIREFTRNSNEVHFLANKFDFVEPQDLPSNVVCSTTVISMTDFLKPSKIIEFTEDKTNSRIDHVLVVVADALGRTQNNTIKNNLIKINCGGPNFIDSNQKNEYNAAVETHVSPAGYKVCLGIEEYLKYLKKLSKDLCN